MQITGGTYKNVLSESVRRCLSLRGWRVEKWVVRHSVVGRRQRGGSTAERVVGSKVGAGTRRWSALAWLKEMRHQQRHNDDERLLGIGAGYFGIETGLKRNIKGRLPGMAAGASDMIAQLKRRSVKERLRRRRD